MKIKHSMEYVLVRLLAWILARLPRESSHALGKYLGTLAYKIMASRDKIASQNLLQSFPGMKEEEAERIVRKCWENLGEGVSDFVRMPGMSKAEFLSITETEGMELLRESYKQGRGVLIITAHYGAWELGVKFLPYSGFEGAVVARKVKNPWVNDLVNRIRETDGTKVILARNAVRESIRWLQQGKALCVLMDHRIMEGGLQAPFFGRPASTTSLPAILALRYKIPVHPIFNWRENGKVKFKIYPAMDFSDLAQDGEGVLNATMRMNSVLEDRIRKMPEAWLWIHNRWKT